MPSPGAGWSPSICRWSWTSVDDVDWSTTMTISPSNKTLATAGVIVHAHPVGYTTPTCSQPHTHCEMENLITKSGKRRTMQRRPSGYSTTEAAVSVWVEMQWTDKSMYICFAHLHKNVGLKMKQTVNDCNGRLIRGTSIVKNETAFPVCRATHSLWNKTLAGA